MCGYVGARPYGGLSRVRVDGCKARRHVPAPRRSAAPCLALLLVLFPREDAGQAAPSRHTTVAVSVSSTRKDFSHASNYRDGRYHRWSPPLLTSSPGPLGNIGRANFSPSRLHRPLRLRLYRTSTSALCLSPSKSLSPAHIAGRRSGGQPGGVQTRGTNVTFPLQVLDSAYLVFPCKLLQLGCAAGRFISTHHEHDPSSNLVSLEPCSSNQALAAQRPRAPHVTFSLKRAVPALLLLF